MGTSASYRTPHSAHASDARPDGRPNIEYIRDVYADLMNMGEGRRRPGDRADISSDEEDDQEALRRGWSKAPLSESSKAIARYWLEKARQRRVLLKLVAGFIKNSTLEMCQLCGRTQASNVTMKADIALNGKFDPRALDVLIKKYEATYPDKEFDGNLWQAFFRANAECITRCSVCIDALEQERNEEAKFGIPARAAERVQETSPPTRKWKTPYLNLW